MEAIPMTIAGAKALEVELLRLKDVERPRIVNEIAAAREHGDLKENAEYHAAKEQQNLIESRIREIESKLSDSQVIDITQIHPTGKVIFGTTIEIKDLNDDMSVTYKMVGEDEADVKFGKISVNSPLSRNLVGKSEGDTFIFESPSGVKEYCIVSIKHL